MGWQTLITTLTTGLAILSFGAFCLLVGLYWLNERRQKATYERAKADLADTALLFQTMRDVVRQQKKLAKEFNSDLDAKITGVKQVLARSLEKNEKLFERQRTLTAELEEAKAQLASLQAQLGRTAPAGGNTAATSAPPRTADALAQLTADLGRARRQGAGPRAASEPDPSTLRETGRTTQPASDWERAPLRTPRAAFLMFGV